MYRPALPQCATPRPAPAENLDKYTGWEIIILSRCSFSSFGKMYRPPCPAPPHPAPPRLAPPRTMPPENLQKCTSWQLKNFQPVHFFQIFEKCTSRPAPPRPTASENLEKCTGWKLIILSRYVFSSFGIMYQPPRPASPRPARKLGKMYLGIKFAGWELIILSRYISFKR